jgi:hypothetical protein
MKSLIERKELRLNQLEYKRKHCKDKQTKFELGLECKKLRLEIKEIKKQELQQLKDKYNEKLLRGTKNFYGY